MSTEKLYQQFRTKGGMDARAAFRAAKILGRWQENECGEHDEPQIGSVRISADPSDEPYDCGDCDEPFTDEHGRRFSADQARKQINEMLERYGNYNLLTEYFDGEEWRHADSIGGCVGYKNPLSPFENWYVVDLMESALDKAENLEPEYAI